MPAWVSSDGLTMLGVVGSLLVAAGLVLAKGHPPYLLLSIAGFAINWFGDSLDGRLAYYRHKPRKWYGWALDISADWISVSVIGTAVYLYLDRFNWIAFLFVFSYGWSMINALLRSKIYDTYSIDRFRLGPTELRIIVCVFLFVELFVGGTLVVFGFVAFAILTTINVVDMLQIVRKGDERDRAERGEVA